MYVHLCMYYQFLQCLSYSIIIVKLKLLYYFSKVISKTRVKRNNNNKKDFREERERESTVYETNKLHVLLLIFKLSCVFLWLYNGCFLNCECLYIINSFLLIIIILFLTVIGLCLIRII